MGKIAEKKRKKPKKEAMNLILTHLGIIYKNGTFQKCLFWYTFIFSSILYASINISYW